MIRYYTLLGISFLTATLFVSGCSTKETKATLKTPKTETSKTIFDKNTKIATDIAKTEKELNLLETKINETPVGKQRIELIQKKTLLKEKILSLREKQIQNAKAFQTSKQQKANTL